MSLVVLIPTTASAHPPYESRVRVVTDSDGHELEVVKSYDDGVFFTDPVKLVVRHPRGKTVAETDYGRAITVVCAFSSKCVVFRYDGLMPILPQDVWWLGEGNLSTSNSLALRLLGVAAPLWDNGLGYLFAVGLFFLPLAVLRVAWSRPTSINGLLVALVGLSATVLLLLIWLYVVVLLSSLLLPLVVILIATLSVLMRKTLRRRPTMRPPTAAAVASDPPTS